MGDAYNGPDIFTENEKNQEINTHKEAVAKQQQAEDEALTYIENIKSQLRENILKLQQTSKALNEDESNKKLRNAAEAFISEARSIITEDYSKNKDILIDKDKYRQSLREAETLITKCDEEADNLEIQLKDIAKKNSLFGKMNRWIEDILKE